MSTVNDAFDAPAAVETAGAARARAVGNFVWLALDKLLAVGLGLLVFGVLARQYGPIGSGHFAYGIALMQTGLSLSLVCGTSAMLPRLCRATTGMPGMIANLFAVRLAGALLAMLGVGAAAIYLVDDRERLVIALLMLATVPFNEPLHAAVAYWQSRNDNRKPMISRAAGLAGRTAVVGIAVLLKAPAWVAALAWMMEMWAWGALHLLWIARAVAPLGRMARSVTLNRSRTYFRFGIRFMFGFAIGNFFLRTDRLLLADLMDPTSFGVYATAMQLTEVWLQVAQITSVAIGPAFFYRELRSGGNRRAAYVRTGLMFGAMGLAGVLFVLVAGAATIDAVFGARFAAGYPYLLAGSVFGLLFFIDQLAQLWITTTARAGLLTIKWSLSCAVAAALQWLLFAHIGAFAGPVGLAGGLVAGWIYLAGWRLVRKP